jgi:hypothetical protein
MEPPAKQVVLRCLIGLALALLLVGVVSRTFLRHVVQILPTVLAAGVLARRPDWGAWAALPIFLFWSLIVVLIWLFLLGFSRIASGHYTPIEVLSTFLMVGCSVVGGIRSVPLGRPLRAVQRILVFIVFALMQLGAMWVSFLTPIANR